VSAHSHNHDNNNNNNNNNNNDDDNNNSHENINNNNNNNTNTNNNNNNDDNNNDNLTLSRSAARYMQDGRAQLLPAQSIMTEQHYATHCNCMELGLFVPAMGSCVCCCCTSILKTSSGQSTHVSLSLHQALRQVTHMMTGMTSLVDT